MKLAIVGGSLLSQMDKMTHHVEEKISTPFGEPSADLVMGRINDIEIVYLNRHGKEHHLAPHQINYRANAFALKLLEVTHIIGVAAVGGITENMEPLKCVVSDQLIDYSYGRMQTFSDQGDVTHIDFSYPYDDFIRNKLINAAIMNGVAYESKATYGVTQGPRLETIAEIKRMKRDGCDIVGMTGMPEATLTRELEMDYASLALVVNWAAGAQPVDNANAEHVHQIVSMDAIRARLLDGNQIIEKIVNTFILDL